MRHTNLFLHVVSAVALSPLGSLLPLDLLQNAVQEGLDGIAGRHGRSAIARIEGKVGQNGIELVSRGQGCRQTLEGLLHLRTTQILLQLVIGALTFGEKLHKTGTVRVRYNSFPSSDAQIFYLNIFILESAALWPLCTQTLP